jgi:hypothetical protein
MSKESTFKCSICDGLVFHTKPGIENHKRSERHQKALENGRLLRQHLLDTNRDGIRAAYREGISRGLSKPMVLLLDGRHEKCRDILDAIGEDLEWAQRYIEETAAQKKVPLFTLVVEATEEMVELLGSMTPHGKMNIERILALPDIPAVVIADCGSSYVNLPREGDPKDWAQIWVHCADTGEEDSDSLKCSHCGAPATVGSYLGPVCDACGEAMKKICDFCGDWSPQWAHPAEDFTVPTGFCHTASGDEVVVDQPIVGEWLACERCNDFIAAKDFACLHGRAVSAQRSRPGGDTPGLDQNLAVLYRGFFEHRSGEPYRISQ